ncbi:MAG: hypothetical protein WC969_05045 [Elusimicrobiota bacterium]|jgi:hypothetical protein
MSKRLIALLAPALVCALAAAASAKTTTFNGQYRLEKKLSGACYAQLQVVPETFGNSKNQDDLGFYGLPEGQGLIAEQVLDINNGLQTDRYTNPMTLLPFQSDLIGYRPRLATSDGRVLTYVQGELSKFRPTLENGEFFQAELKDGLLLIRKGKVVESAFVLQDSCVYVRTK